MLKEMPAVRIRFDYEIYNAEGKLINSGHTVQAFINAETNRPTRIPASIKELLEPYF